MPTSHLIALAVVILLLLTAMSIGESMRESQPDYGRYFLSVMLAGLVAIVILVGLMVKARAHDHEHPELDDWYLSLKSKEGHPCCEGPGKDATHLSEIDWDTKDGHYRVRIEGRWFVVPDEAVITEPNRDGRAIVWGYPMTSYGEDGSRHMIDYNIRCFTPGAGG